MGISDHRRNDDMTENTIEKSPLAYARTAGILYLIIIVFGIFSEVFARMRLISTGDAAITADKIMNSLVLFRIGFFADTIMFLSDVALGVLLFVLLRPVNRVLALAALVFRLTQTAVLALNLLNYYAADLILNGAGYASMYAPDQSHSLAYFFLDLHSHGYDLGLILFGFHCLLLGRLIFKSQFLPKALGILMTAAGLTYLIGSYTRFLLPEYLEFVAPIYAVALIAELSLCLWLLVKGVKVDLWRIADAG